MHEPLCETILENLCSAVHKIQEEYASGCEVIKDGDSVNQLCQSVDGILSHGLKEGILSWASNAEVTYWPLAARITYRQVVQDIISRQELKTDRDRCQVWVRFAVQENALGSYLHVITQDDKLQREFYNPHAFVCDKEKVETAKTALLYGLSHLDFNISVTIPVDSLYVGKTENSSKPDSLIGHFPARPSVVNGYQTHYSPSNSYTDQESLPSTNSLIRNEVSKKKKRKKKSAEVVVIADSLDNGQGMFTAIEKYLSLSGADINGKQVKDERSQSESNVDTSKGSEPDHGALSNVSQKSSSSCNSNFSHSRIITEGKRETKAVSDQITSKYDTMSYDEFGSCETGNGSFLLNRTDFSKKQDLGEYIQTEDASKPEIKSSEHVNTETSTEEKIQTAEDFGENSNPFTMEDKSSPLSSMPSNHLLSSVFVEIEVGESKEIQDDSIREVEYQVSHAKFEFGTPKEVLYAEEAAKERCASQISYEENEDLNFVPGIHKNNEQLSRSSSLNSFTGSGSFSKGQKSGTDKKKRTSTMDSTKSSLGSSLPSESWKYITNYFSGSVRKDSKPDDISVTTEDSFSDLGIFDELLGIDEDHFSPPESFMGFSSSEELQNAVHSCKALIRTAPEKSLERKQFVEKLIQLRIRLQETKQDDTPAESNTNLKKILGHQFVKEDGPGPSNHLCDRCGKWIWSMWQSLFTCQACKFHSHRKCLHVIRRPCASRKVSVSSYSIAICPEPGLSSQQYKCAECRKIISLNKSEHAEARLCDYSGQFFCEDCHWNDHDIIPARIVHNWDFTAYKVARQTKQLLTLMINKPQLHLEQLNPALFKFVGELREIKRLREEILIMKKYFMSCRSALESKLLLHLQDRQHFVDNSFLYSLQDMIDVERGTLLPFITRVHSLFLTHIKTDCELCQAKGFVCELCKASEIIFAFDPHAIQCPKCRTVFHKVCFKCEPSCPKCERKQKRTIK